MATGNNLQGLINFAGNTLNSLIPLLIAFALVVFFWGLVQYIMSAGESHAQGRNVMIAGITALFVMVSIWGIIRLVQNTLGVGSGAALPPPQVELNH
ncbi:MAG TPA: hypothetical protein VG753_02285 [Candidatus Paceibacterota bacterium]|nr:hypothetical protein [Candidatus Paceibacterota bacterium]